VPAVTQRSAFGGGDQQYLRDVQYGNSAKLDARSYLHRTFASSPLPLPTFEARLVDWSNVRTVLECGSGNGRFWDNDELSRSLHLTITDLSPGMVTEAVKRARAAGFEHVQGQACDVQSLPFADGEFDIVLANHMLYHVPDPDLAIGELARVLKPDGTALIATNAYGHMREINSAVDEVFGHFEEGLYEVFGLDTGERRLREKFSSITWHAFDNDLIVDDPEAVVAYGLSYPPGETTTAEQRAEFRAAVERRFTDGHLRIHTRAGVFVCRSLKRQARV
jgi:SAM-dependent methyltransferase